MYEKILVPLDGSELAEAAVPLAAAVAKARVARLSLVHVQQLPAAEAYLARVAEGPSADLHESIDTAVINPGDAHLSTAETAAHISSYAKQHGFDLIVMSTRGHSGLKRMFEGSVAEALLSVTPCPVLYCRPSPGVRLLRPGPHPIRKLLIALDQTPGSEVVLDSAAGLASALKAEVIVVHVLEPMRALATVTGIELASYSAIEWAEVNARTDAYLAGVVERLAAGGIQSTAEKLVSNDVGGAIMEACTRLEADMIALASNAPKGLVRAILGSVGDRLVRSASCPVLVIRS